jgi:hypothetical protein
MAWKIKCNHVALFPYGSVVHDTVLSTAVRSSGKEEVDVLLPVTALLVENLASSPNWCSDVGISANNIVFISLGLFIGLHGAAVGIVESSRALRQKWVYLL